MAALFDTQVKLSKREREGSDGIALEPLAAAATTSSAERAKQLDAKRPAATSRSATLDSIAQQSSHHASAASSTAQLGGLGALSQNASASALNAREAESAETDFVEGGAEGWMVVAGCATMFFVVLGLLYSFGVIAAELTKRRLASSSTLGWLSSTTIVLCSIFAFQCTSLVRRLGNAWAGFIAALCVGIGYILTSFSFHSLPFLFCSQAIFGMGYAVAFAACNSLAGQYFQRRRGLAMGIVYGGSGVGGAVCSITLSRLVAKVGLEWAVRTYGLIALAVLIPASWTLKHRDKPAPTSFRLSYLKDPNFRLLLGSTALITFSLFVPPFFLPTFAVSAGYSSETGAWLVAGYNLSSAIGRVLFGILADTRYGPITSLMTAMLLMATSILGIWTIGDSLAIMIVFMLVNGAASGALLSLMPTVNAALFGMQEVAVTMSMLTASRAFGAAFGSPSAGYLLDAFGGPSSGMKAYRPALLMLGGVSLISASLLMVLRWRIGGLDMKKRV